MKQSFFGVQFEISTLFVNVFAPVTVATAFSNTPE